MANFYVSSVGWTAVTAWASGVNKSVGNYVRQTAPAVASERVFKCTSKSGTGTTGGAEPTWVLTKGATTTDNAGANQIVWTEVTGLESEQASNAWAAPAARVAGFPSTRVASGDTVFVSQDHAETQGATLTFPNLSAINVNIICVNRGVGSSVPPVTADLATTASVSTSTTFAIANLGTGTTAYYIRGITFTAGSGNNSTAFTVGGTSNFITLDTCTLELGTTNAGSRLILGNNSGALNPTYIILKDTIMKFGAAGQSFQNNGGFVTWYNTPSFASPNTSGSAPTILMSNTGSAFAQFEARGIDLSNVTGTIVTGTPIRNITFANCKLGSGVTLVSGSNPVNTPGNFIQIDNSDDSGNARNYRHYRASYGGVTQQDIAVIRTAGASDGVTAQSWKIVTDGNAAPTVAFATRAIAKRYNTTGSGVTATVYFIVNAASALTNAQIWLEIEGLTVSGVPQSNIKDNRIADLLPSTASAGQSTDTSAWDTAATARQNNHAYAVGDVFQVTGTSPGRMFIVTTAGTSAVSEPAAYGTAVDGTTITTDRNGGGLVVQTMMRQKLAVTFTPQVKGIVKATVKIAVASTTLYLDPMLNIA